MRQGCVFAFARALAPCGCLYALRARTIGYADATQIALLTVHLRSNFVCRNKVVDLTISTDLTEKKKHG
jgi:hypothetical protein